MITVQLTITVYEEQDTVMSVIRCTMNWTQFVCLFSWRYNTLWLYFHSPVVGFSLLVFPRFLDHTQRRTTVGRTALDE